MKKILFFLAIFISSLSFAQLENANWCFGDHARLTFTPAPTSSWSALNTNFPTGYSGNASSVSDNNGNLLFYTDAMTVWDRSNNVMSNGTQLYGATDQIAGKQNSVIVPKPNHPGIYYLFTISYFLPGWSPFGHGGIHYSVIDMSLNGGNGDVVSGLKNITLKNHAGTPIDFDYSTYMGLQIYQTKITTTLHDDGDKIWVTVFTHYIEAGIQRLYSFSYLVTENGINDGTNNIPDGTSPKPASYDQLDNSIYNTTIYDVWNGTIKISPDGKYLGDAAWNCVLLYNFNDQTGNVVLKRVVSTSGTGNPWNAYFGGGLEFSPDSKLVYFSGGDIIFQDGISSFGGGSGNTQKYMRIFQHAISKDSTHQIGQYELIDSIDGHGITTPLPAVYPCGLQLSIDNKIYACVSYPIIGSGMWLGIIHQPNVPSTVVILF